MATSAQKRAAAAEPTELTIEELGALVSVYNDFVLVKPIEIPVSATIVESEHWKQNPNRAIVVAVGEGRVVGGLLLSIGCRPGETVYITKYGEDVNVEGVKLQLVHASEVKFGWK
ncbi:MAG: co-chaperone GroES family protein [Candidatus Acidiferrales bacterium]